MIERNNALLRGRTRWIVFLAFFMLECGGGTPIPADVADVSAVPVQPVSSIKAPDIMALVDPCRGAEINETLTLKIVLFPAGGKSITQTCLVIIYHFHKGEKP
jgi:hypothetical protein